MTNGGWKFFDFDTHWNIFYTAWKSDIVQDFLKNDLDNCIYCQNKIEKIVQIKN